MRRICFSLIIFLGIFAISANAFGQMDAEGQTALEAVSYEGLERRLERNNRQIDPEKHNFIDRLFNRHERPGTWLSRADIFMDIHGANIDFVRMGMPLEEFELFFGEPNEIRTEETDMGERDIYVFDRIEFYFEEEVLTGWRETDPFMEEDPLPKAYDAIKKAIELDDGSNKEDIEVELERLNGSFVQNAINYYEFGEMEEAYKNFSSAIEVTEMPEYGGEIDTALYYNAGFVSYELGKYEEALGHYYSAKELDYGGSDTYLLIMDTYMALDDREGAERILQEGFEKYPDDSALLVEMINFYLEGDESDRALEYLELALEQEPDNPSYYFAMGALYEREGEMDKAIEAYENAYEIDPEMFEVNYNIGAFYYNKALDMFDEAQEIADHEEYEKARDEAFEVLEEALPYMEKAHELDPEDQDAMETLRIIYYRLGMEEEYEEMSRKLGVEVE